MMSRFVIVVALGAIAGCGDHEANELERVKRAVCSCQDAKCAEAAMKDLPRRDIKASHHARGVARDLLDCLAKLYEADRPSTDPDTGSASARLP